MTASPHVSHQLDEWIDGRLSSADESDVDRHLEECASCRAEAAALRAVRAAVAGRDADLELPAGLEGRIRGLLDAEDATARKQVRSAGATREGRRPRSGPSRRSLAWALPLAAGLLIAVGASFWAARTKPQAGPIADAFSQFSELTGARETWRTLQVASASELKERWRAAHLGFPTRVLDLSMAGFELAGGRATHLGGQPAALAIYRGPDGIVTCWMFDGRNRREDDFPQAVDVHEANGFRFHVFERDGDTVVVWREGEVLCVLAGGMDRDSVVKLAHAKAMAPSLA